MRKLDEDALVLRWILMYSLKQRLLESFESPSRPRQQPRSTICWSLLLVLCCGRQCIALRGVSEVLTHHLAIVEISCSAKVVGNTWWYATLSFGRSCNVMQHASLSRHRMSWLRWWHVVLQGISNDGRIGNSTCQCPQIWGLHSQHWQSSSVILQIFKKSVFFSDCLYTPSLVSASALRQLNYMWASMGKSRLLSLALLHIHYDNYASRPRQW